MSLRIAASLLTVVFCISAYAADDGATATGIIVGHPVEAADLTIVNSPQAWVQFSGNRIVRSKAAHLTNAVDSLFNNPHEHEFPFSPRLIRQSNYDTRIRLESVDSPRFVFTAETLSNGNIGTLTDGVMILQVAGADVASPSPLLLNCDSDGACLRCTNLSGLSDGDVEFKVGQIVVQQNGVCVSLQSAAEECSETCCADERPIDVLMADSEECCGEAVAVANEDCGEPASAHGDAPARPIPPAFLPLHGLLGGTGLWLSGSPTDGVFILSAEAPTLGDADEPPAEFGGFVECVVECDVDREPRAVGHSPEPPPALPIAAIDPASAVFASDACSHAEPPLKAKVEHLLEAARHLAGAGYEDEAKLFRVEAEAIQSASTRLLTEKRQELERLQQEIAELESLTGQYQMIQINCRVMELSLPSNCEAGTDLTAFQQPGIHVLTGQPCSSLSAPSRLLTGAELAHALHVMEAHPCGQLKTLAEPVILTMNGRPATLRSGGEFPILIPTAGTSAAAKPQAKIEWKNFGVMMQAVPFVQGDGKVRLNLETEISDRDFSHATTVGGIVVPGLTSRRFHSDIETQFGETVAIAMNSTPADGGSKCLLVLVTAHQVEPQTQQPQRD